MFRLYLCLELSSTQIVFSHYMPSLMHILKMMIVVMTLQPTLEYLTFCEATSCPSTPGSMR
jgi:hypothetical protein